MNQMPDDQTAVAARVASVLDRHGVRLTLGGEPTFVPVEPVGAEWHHAAVGPTKLGYARKVAEHLLAGPLGGGVAFFAPGKSYPGELNPRWALWLVARRDGRPLFTTAGAAAATATSVGRFRTAFCGALGLEDGWRHFEDPLDESRAREVWAILVDRADDAWKAGHWPQNATTLTAADGPAGLRLPLHLVPEGVPRRAVVLERCGDRLDVFLPPLLQAPFVELLAMLQASLAAAGIGPVALQGAPPADEAGCWTMIGLTADPGVLEINLPVCHGWKEYDHWLRCVTEAAEAAGLRAWREQGGRLPEDTGGGNHLLWGGPTLDHNPFFTRPAWIASMLRYWQRHPSLSYGFSGKYVGPHSQAPRADESGWPFHDLDWAWSYLESLPATADRGALADAIRHLQVDTTGNAHRSEICFDKFWNPGLPAGTCGLIEFRALASLPHATWSSSVALLWSALAAWLLEHPCRERPRDFGRSLHDRYLLPTILWDDLAGVLADLRGGGFPLAESIYRDIWNWRFPAVLEWAAGEARLTVRQAVEPWPLLSDPAPDGTTTSRFVDTSLHRLECTANAAFVAGWQLRIANRPLPLRPVALRHEPRTAWMAGLRYRRTKLQPSLHPGIECTMPLTLSVLSDRASHEYTLHDDSSVFRQERAGPAPPAGPRCRPLHPDDLTHDLRVDRDSR